MHQAATTQSPETLGPVMKEIMGKPFRELMATMTADYDGLKKRMEDAGLIMSSEVAVKLKALGNEFSLLSRIVATQLGPTLIKLAEWAYGVVLKGGKLAGQYQDSTADLDQLDKEAAANAANRGMPEVGFAKRFLKGANYQSDLFGIMGDSDYDKKKAELQRKYLVSMYGEDVTAETLKDFKPNSSKQDEWTQREKEYAKFLEQLEASAKNLDNPKPPDFESEVETKSKGRAKDLHGHLTSLQEIGAYASPAQVTLLDTAKRSEKHLEVIKNHLVKIGASGGMNDALTGGPKY